MLFVLSHFYERLGTIYRIVQCVNRIYLAHDKKKQNYKKEDFIIYSYFNELFFNNIIHNKL